MARQQPPIKPKAQLTRLKTTTNMENIISITEKIVGTKISKDLSPEECAIMIRDYLENIIAPMPGQVYWVNTNGVYLGCNDELARTAGLKSRDEIVGKTDHDLPWRENAEKYMENDRQAIKSGAAKVFEETAILADGAHKTFLTYKVPQKDKQGKVIGILGISIDISARKKMEQELEISKLKAEEASELKSQFIMNMQHDLRTPASGVAAMLEILAKNESDSVKKETLKEVADSSRRLLNILNAILEFDSVEKGTLPVLSEKFNLHDIIKDVEALEAPTATLKQLEIKTHIDDRLPKELIGDPFRLQRILINLLSNAIKFTTKGYVEIDEILWEHVDDKNVLVQIIVKDTGIGIPQDKQKVIFERFTRLDPANKGIYSGLGLGLSMVKQFVEEMNGRIEIKSSPGTGTTFICTLPFKLPEPDKIAQTKITSDTESSEQTFDLPPSSSKILLVEDDRIAQLIGKSLIADEFHAQLDIATTGKEAIDLVRKTTPLYDLIFMDIGLPDGSGCEFAKQIHELSAETATIPIVALTAHDNDDVRQDCRVCGMQDYLTKPLGVLKMDRIFRKWLHRSMDHTQPTTTGTSAKQKPIFDLAEATKMHSGNAKKAKEMIHMFMAMLPEYETSLKESLKNNNFDALRDTAHKLRGATLYCCTPRLTEAAKTLEEKIRLTKKPTKVEIKPLYTTLLTEINNLKDASKEI